MAKSLTAAEITVSRDVEKKINPANDVDPWDFDDDDPVDPDTDPN